MGERGRGLVVNVRSVERGLLHVAERRQPVQDFPGHFRQPDVIHFWGLK